jgi:amyloid beta precursor protein binding protein 1
MVCGDVGVPVERLAAGYVEEIQRSWDHARGAPVEITTVASVVGGIAANEAVKLIVQKFQPINNSVIYDGANLEYCVDFKI